MLGMVGSTVEGTQGRVVERIKRDGGEKYEVRDRSGNMKEVQEKEGRKGRRKRKKEEEVRGVG